MVELFPRFQFPSLRQIVHQASKIISVICFGIIAAAMLMALLGYMPLAF